MHRETLDVVETHLRLCSRYYGACFETLIWFFCYYFAHSEISLSISKKKKDSSRNSRAKYNLEDGVAVLAQPYVFSTLIEHAFSTDDSTRYTRTLP